MIRVLLSAQRREEALVPRMRMPESSLAEHPSVGSIIRLCVDTPDET